MWTRCRKAGRHGCAGAARRGWWRARGRSVSRRPAPTSSNPESPEIRLKSACPPADAIAVAASGESSNLRAAAVTHEAHGAKANVNGGDRAVGARPRPAREDRRPLVLVADDDHVTSRIIQGALAQVGFRTSKAHDGQSTLREIRREQPDLILLDVA